MFFFCTDGGVIGSNISAFSDKKAAVLLEVAVGTIPIKSDKSDNITALSYVAIPVLPLLVDTFWAWTWTWTILCPSPSFFHQQLYPAFVITDIGCITRIFSTSTSSVGVISRTCQLYGDIRNCCHYILVWEGNHHCHHHHNEKKCWERNCYYCIILIVCKTYKTIAKLDLILYNIYLCLC